MPNPLKTRLPYVLINFDELFSYWIQSKKKKKEKKKKSFAEINFLFYKYYTKTIALSFHYPQVRKFYFETNGLKRIG
jgi:predicted branched-subunit amino acid permease